MTVNLIKRTPDAIDPATGAAIYRATGYPPIPRSQPLRSFRLR